ncbi:MAG: glycerol kinase GlpK [Paraglaciecola sp.]|uniref:FGGY family carbohydrate kinase n=1 Tax=Paraglaciecola sp. TaxID=1920173 RepID=UPI00329A4D4E
MSYILAIDQSTSATKALLFDTKGQVLDRQSSEHQQYYPQPGWVEHDAEEIWQNVLSVTQELLGRHQSCLNQLLGLSMTNQRETIVVFDKATGKPLFPAIVWQCRRSVSICASHSDAGSESLIHSKTGLRLDAYFSGSKLQWLIEQNPELLTKLTSGEALIGTIDTYLVYRLTQGKVFATDPSNASRTLLFDITTLRWDQSLCALWKVPMQALPEVRESHDNFGCTTLNGLLPSPMPIVGVIGDSQASLFAQRCFAEGSAKVTFGTGSSVLLNIGDKPVLSESGVVTALAWIMNGQPTYAFEGIIISSAATLNWLQNQLGLFNNVAEIEAFAKQVDDEEGVYLVPAFSGLGLPYWQPQARAAIVGLSGHSDKRHIARASLNSMTYQLRDVLDAMQSESGVKLSALQADGGPTVNQLLMQFTADITGIKLAVSDNAECSALGAVMMGLLGLGIYTSIESLAEIGRIETSYQPNMMTDKVKTLRAGWQCAVNQVLVGAINHNLKDGTA